MYHIQVPDTTIHVFLEDDPRPEGFEGGVQENVSLVPADPSWYKWPYGAPSPDVCLGVSAEDESRYKVFRTTEECRREGYRRLGRNFYTWSSWSECEKWLPHLKGGLNPNDPMEREFMEELARGRREDLDQTLREDDQECPSSSSTPTT